MMMMIQMMMMKVLFLLLFASGPMLTTTCAFTVVVVKPFQQQQTQSQLRYHHHHNHRHLLLLFSSKTIGDGEEQQQKQLRSSYPDGTPAILRGEAVRSALKSGRCITWSFSSSSSSSSNESPFSNGGLLEIKGRGTINFLNNKLTQSFDNNDDSSSENNNTYKESILLDPKGRIVDKINVCCCYNPPTNKAYLITSPGYSSQTLLNRLNPYIFPLDEVTLTNYDDSTTTTKTLFSFTIASTKIEHVQNVLKTQAFTNNQNKKSLISLLDFPSTNNGEFKIWTLNDDDDSKTTQKVLVIPSTGLPTIACVGYTLVFFNDNNNNNDNNDDDDDNVDDNETASVSSSLGNNIYQYLISEINADGPIEIGELEYETLRIEVGQPSYGYEYRISNKKLKKDDKVISSTSSDDDDNDIKTSPLELYWGDDSKFIDYDKGCYLGQEGIASIIKNPRGPPRTLYSIIFEDEYNNYDNNNDDSSGDDDNDNLTTYPKVGQSLYALGSSEQINVGTITSIGEICGTGESTIVGLALIKRSDTILKQLTKYDITIPTRSSEDIIDITESSGLIQPPPLDPLDGLEVIIGGTYTVGKLRSIPSRRSSSGGGGGGLNNQNTNNMFDEEIIVDMPDISITTTPQPIPDDDDEKTSIDEQNDNTNDDDDASAAAAAAGKEAEEAAAAMEAEAKRKAEKMELLRKRAEEAMARRKKKKKQQSKQE